MPKLSRKDFMSLFSMLFAFAPVAKTLANAGTSKNESTQDAPGPLTDIEPDLPIEKYESGTAESITNNNIVLVNSHGKVTLHMSDDTTVWDGIRWVGEISPEAGDQIIAWGNRNPDNGGMSRSV